ncbi:MAG: hypothetical protein K2V38_03700 [Gemmataceae bacterium]|nr:hypothetical protein [Gemmataceae bacterium]
MKHHLSKPTALLLFATFSGVGQGLVPGAELHFCSLADGQVVEVPGRLTLSGISDDGRTVSGANSNNGQFDYYSWNSLRGFTQSQASFSAINQTNVPISGDGHIFGGSDPQAFVFRDSGVRTNIGTGSPNLNSSNIEGLSRDGSAAAGWSQATGAFAGWRWTSAGGLQFLPGFVTARGISGDGNTVVGTGLSGDTTALVWHNGVTTTLPEAPGSSGVPYIQAWGTNFDGSIVVGGSRSNAAVWRNGQGTAIPLLPVVPGQFVQQIATDLSNDSNVILGSAFFTSSPDTAFIWTPTRGTELLSSYFASYGVSLPAGQSIFSATVTTDGRTFGVTTIVADRSASYGYIVTLPTPTGVTCMFVGLLAASRRKRS